MTASPNLQPTARLIFLFSLFWLLIWLPAEPPSGDELETLEVANGLYATGAPIRIALGGQSLGQDNKSKYGIGQSLIDLPGIVASKWIARSAPDAPNFAHNLAWHIPAYLLAAWAAAMLFAICRELGHGPRAASIVPIAALAASPWWFHARTIFSDMTIAVCVIGAILAALRYESSGLRRHAAIAGAFLGFGAISKIGAVINVPLIALYFAYLCLRKCPPRTTNDAANPSDAADPTTAPVAASPLPDLIRVALAFAAPLAVAALWLLAYNNYRFGSPWTSGYATGRDASLGFNVPLWVGLYGMLFSSGKSIFLYSPLLVAALFGWKPLLQRRPAAGALLLAVCASGILFYARWWAWHGDWTWANRHIVYAVTLGIVPLAELRFSMARGLGLRAARMRRVALAAALALGFAINILGVVIPRAIPFIVATSGLSQPLFGKYPLYDEANWRLQDDMVHLHYIPYFSPLVMNAWLAQCIRHKGDWSADEMAERAPWMQLNDAWKPVMPEPLIAALNYNLWFAKYPGRVWGSGETAYLAIAGFGLLATAAALLLRLKD